MLISERDTIKGDLLEGADEIARFMFDDPGKRRKIYHLADKAELPVFRLGTVICARKSTLMAWIESRERSAVSGGETATRDAAGA